ncbi:hypothetical protein ACWEQ8_11535 [Streptomyces noursei]
MLEGRPTVDRAGRTARPAGVEHRGQQRSKGSQQRLGQRENSRPDHHGNVDDHEDHQVAKAHPIQVSDEDHAPRGARGRLLHGVRAPSHAGVGRVEVLTVTW